MANFVVNDHEYRSTPMGAVTQAKVARRLAPAFEKIMEAVRSSGAGDDAFVKVIVAAVKEIDDEAIDFIVEHCLELCHRKAPNGSGYTPVWNKAARVCQFGDMNMPEMFGVCAKVIQSELGSFFPVSPTSSVAA